jgi:hypothetical protein
VRRRKRRKKSEFVPCCALIDWAPSSASPARASDWSTERARMAKEFVAADPEGPGGAVWRIPLPAFSPVYHRRRRMGYRDEQEGLRARVADLQEDLARAQQTIERLTGEGAPRGEGQVVEQSRLLGTPRRVILERELAFEVGDDGFEAIAALLRPRLGAVQQVGRTLHATGFSLQIVDGATRIRMTSDHRALPLAAVSCSVLAGGFAALALFAILHDLVSRSLAQANVLWMVPLCVLLVFPLARAASRRQALALEKQLCATFEAAVEVARRHAKQRVLLPGALGVEEPLAAESEADAEAEQAVERRPRGDQA